jgi:hypothetical protein
MWKFSSYGSGGDYDRDCFWLFEKELEEGLVELLVV